ncbi:MAG: hypothetical protein WC796_01265 [Candidatus Pacearchaeota archaeon]|jgi:hypothetical protein
MKLAEYLRAIGECPDEELASRLGVYDNWPILLKVDFEKLFNYFRNSGIYSHQGTKNYKNPSGRCEFFDFIPGTVSIQVCDYTSGGKMYGEEVYEIIDRRGYNARISLHDDQERKMPVHDHRAIAIVIEGISTNFIIPESIPMMFPSSIGHNNLENKSQRVSFPDEDEIAMFGK